MSAFDTLFAQVATPALKAHNGQAVTYKVTGDADVATTALVGAERTEEPTGGDRGREKIIVRDVVLDLADVPSPELQATIDIGGVEWDVIGGPQISGNFARLTVKLADTVERGRPGYRAGEG